MDDDFPIRINRYLAKKNFSTRKGADKLIEKKLVLINDNIARLGDKVNKGDKVEVIQKSPSNEYVYYAYNKPVGLVSMAPQKDERGILDSINLKGVFPVGRLDKESSGLIILTNDGRVTDRLLNPIYDHEKEYVVETKEKLRNNFKEKMETGVNIEGYITDKAKVKVLGDKKFSIVLREGKKHQIRRMCVALFNEVKTLKRVRIMNINLENLSPNSYRKIEGSELKTFLNLLGL